jgi:hypothetical protein
MNEQQAARTLVKSAPELWAACSDPDTLSRHLRVFGEIKITRLEPETTVAWEGESASGTVVLEPSGWGTKVRLTAEVTSAPVSAPEPELLPRPVAEEVPPAPEPAVAVPAASVVPEPAAAEPKPSGGFFSRWRKSPPVAPTPAPVAVVEPEAVPEPAPIVEPEPEPVASAAPEPTPVAAPEPAPVIDALAALEAALDSLGQAHHRPYSLT